MKQLSTTSVEPAFAVSVRACVASLAVALALGACGGGSGGGGSSSGLPQGSVAVNPSTGLSFVVDANQGGQAGGLNLRGVYWGRLVDIVDVDRVLVFRNFVIGEDIRSDGVNYLLERNPVTELETLTILHQQGTPEFDAAFSVVESNVQPLLKKGLGAGVLPPFTMVARNSALVVRFDDLLNDGGNPTSPTYPGTVTSETVRVGVGYPPATPYELRVIPDPNHGDLSNGEFHSTRVILDLTVSKLEAQVLGVPINSLGLPEAITNSSPNLAVRIPTRKDQGSSQFEILRNLAGNGVNAAANGPNDPFSPTFDVVRSARSGGSNISPPDPNNGFLFDDIPPEIVGAQAITMFSSGPVVPGGDEFVVTVNFSSTTCATKPRIGDIIELSAHTLEVIQPGGPPINGVVTGVQTRVLVGDPATLISSTGQYRTIWDSSTGALPECFFRFSPAAGTLPNLKVRPDADLIVSFSEPLDPASVQAFDTFKLEYDKNPNGNNPLYKRVVGNVQPSVNLLEFTFQPSLPLRNHGNPSAAPESYTFTVLADDSGTPNVTEGVIDLAGNPLREGLPPVQFFIDPAQPAVSSAGVSLTFSDPDEDLNGGPEIRGQILSDPVLGIIKPRPVTHFSAQADPFQAVPGSMVQIALPIVTPLSNYGSRMMGVWRYFDLGFTLLDDTNHNLDVEGLWWEPYGGTVTPDYFPAFELTLSHSAYLPDEDIDTGLLPTAPGSGLLNTFAQNELSTFVPGANDPPRVMSAKADGYLIAQLDVQPSANGRNIIPWPINRNSSPGNYKYWTWRDTSILAVAGPKGFGADPRRLQKVNSSVAIPSFYKVNEVPTIALPMLMDFKTWSDATSIGQNGFQIAIAINSSARPFFRTFSTGGALTSGAPKIIDPAQANIGKGGVNPASGNTTPPQDNAFYFGQADFVVRVNRAYTIWFNALGSSSFASAVVEPLASQQPSGTQLTLAFRGATGVSNSSGLKPWENAGLMDPYGDGYNGNQLNKLNLNTNLVYTVAYLNGDSTWHTDIADLNGASFVQVRATMISNPDTGLSPTLSAIGLAFIK